MSCLARTKAVLSVAQEVSVVLSRIQIRLEARACRGKAKIRPSSTLVRYEYQLQRKIRRILSDMTSFRTPEHRGDFCHIT